jgi:Uma2 family endonuclease
MNEPNRASETNGMQAGEPAWRVALLFPSQGNWTEQDYLSLDAGGLVEFEQGFIEVLDMPTKEHQRIVRRLFLLMQAFVSQHDLGELFFAPLPVRLWQGKYREPDIVFVRPDRAEFEGYPLGADLVVEVVSGSAADRRRDLQLKVDEYARAGIPEYWIVDPADSSISVLQLQDDRYTRRTSRCTEIAHSVLLDGFQARVSEVLAE